MKAILHGGPFDGKEMTLQESRLELLLDDSSSGRVVPVRYVLHYTDKRGILHFYVPTSSSEPGSRR